MSNVKTGFTLFETLIYVSIVTAVLLAALGILNIITRIHSGQVARTEVNRNIDFINQRFTYWGGIAKAVYPASAATSTDEVRFINDDTFAKFWLDTSLGAIKFQEATGTPENLSTSKVTVSAAGASGKLFEIKENSVQMNTKIAYVSGANPYAKFERIAQSSVTVRSQGALWPNGLVGYWGMDEKQASSTQVFDGSGNGNEGTIRGSALRFDGSDDYVNKVSFVSLPVSAITVEAWFKVDAHKNTNRIISHDWLISGGGGWVLFTDFAGTISWGVYDGAQKLATGPVLATDTWYHVVGTFNTANDQIQIYVNGIAGTPNSSAIGSLDSAGNVDIGGAAAGTRFDGVIDEVRIYNRELLVAEVKEHYNNQFLNSSGLVLYVPFSNRSGTTATDYSPSANNMTLNTTAPAPGFSNTSGGAGDTSSSGWTTYGRPNRTTLGKFGNALVPQNISLPAILNDNISILDADSLEGMNKLTVAAWIYRNDLDGANCNTILEKLNTYLFRICTNLEGWVHNGAFYINVANASSIISNGVWSHIAYIWDGSSGLRGNVYINGIDVTTGGNAQSENAQMTTNPLWIGSRGNTTNFFNGTIDEVRLYNRVLSPSEISLQYNALK